MAESTHFTGPSQPPDAVAHHSRGMALMQQGHFGQGLPLLKLALEAEPGTGQYWLSYAHGLLVAGNPGAALSVIQKAIDGGLTVPVALSLRQDAQAALLRSQTQPKEPTASELDRLDTLLGAGRHAEVEQYVAALLSRYTESGYLWSVLGFSRLNLKKDAIDALQRATVLLPGDASAHNTLGVALQKAGRMNEALAEFRLAIQFSPKNYEAHCNMGNTLRDMGEVREAVTCYHTALSINAKFAEAHNNLGNAWRDLGLLDDAVASIRMALKINPHHAPAHNNLGMLLMDLGRYEESNASFAQAVELKPAYFQAFSNLLFVQSLLPSASPDEMLTLAMRYGSLVAPSRETQSAEPVNPDPEKCLRIGLVSGDFRSHPVGYFVESTLKAMSVVQAGKIEFYGFSNHFLEDDLTSRLKQYCSAWHQVAGISDEQLAQRIVHDQIDILVDLSGHTAHNRLPLFALKPAPLQVSWLGYFATTGVAAIDYLIADPVTLPASEERYFTEKIWRLPQTRLCFTPPDVDIAISSLPALHNNYITFGCFNSLAKMNDEVVALWSKVLLRVPNSRLFLKAKQLRETSVCQSVINRFGAQGVHIDRLILEGNEPRAAYLAAYHRVDIALDPFPYPGGATTAEALWMGVPVLTLAGQRFLSRQGVGLLVNASLEEWVASDAEDYAQRAVTFSSDLGSLAKLRQGLRNQVMNSAVFDGQRFADSLAAAFRAMWRTQTTPPLPG